MTTQVKKPTWQFAATSGTYLSVAKILEFVRKCVRKWRSIFEDLLTWIFCRRLVRQIEPGKFEDVERTHSNRWEYRGY